MSSFIFSECIASHFSILVDYYFKFSFDLKVILYIAKHEFIHGDLALEMQVKNVITKDRFYTGQGF